MDIITRKYLLRSPLFRCLILVLFIAFTTLFYLRQYSPQVFYGNTPREVFLTKEWIDPRKDKSLYQNVTRVNAAIVVLVRNSELYQIRSSMRQFEDRWNKKFNYPYVFLNDEEFTEEFKVFTSSLTKAKTQYGVIPKQMWSYPQWIDQEEAARTRREMESKGVIYGGSESYRHMCRFNSGFFFLHPLLLPFDYYWRLEPSVDFMCDLDYDPFLFMKKNKLVYGFTISLLEFEATIPTLWKTVKKFVEEHPQYVSKDNIMDFISDDGGKTYNLCHFWSNFEIADLNFWRSSPYREFFNYLDKSGGFFYERWGDAPVHSIAVALFTQKSRVHFFNDIAYRHAPYAHCPEEREYHDTGRCHCNPGDNFDSDWYSCTLKWFKV
ncbi:13565_t:CDS:2 [Acaulospora morrowiae]|uniref:13565_t:CDS:1 n=1 Tax=Acaulospora morrowiae TaxID=94023 RepID=A0A9N8YNR9_9GLOM|nr:13565_t:CDS:2 [Acaulospora morrowiae]